VPKRPPGRLLGLGPRVGPRPTRGWAPPAGSVYSAAVSSTAWAAAAVDETLDPVQALGRASAEVLERLGESPELVIGFVAAAHGASPRQLADWSRGLAGGRRRVIVQVEGLLSQAGEHTATPAVAVLGLTGDVGEGDAVHSFDHARGRECELGDELVEYFGDLTADDLVVVIADAHALDARKLAAGLGSCGPAGLLGLGVEGPEGGGAAHAVDGEAFSAGAVAIRLRPPSEFRCALAPATALYAARTVTRSQDNWILELDGVSALEEFRDAAGTLWDDERRAARSVLVARPARPGGPPDAALVRAVVGVDEARAAIALSEAVEPGERVAFARRDPIAAREAMAAAAERLRPPAGTDPGAGLGLAATCRARGEPLFGHMGIESGYLAHAFEPLPWLGLVGSYQLVAGAHGPNLLTHTSALVRLS